MNTASHTIDLSFDNQVSFNCSCLRERIRANFTQRNLALTLNKTRIRRRHTFVEGLTPRTATVGHTSRACLVHLAFRQPGASISFRSPRCAFRIVQRVSIDTGESAFTEGTARGFDAGTATGSSWPENRIEGVDNIRTMLVSFDQGVISIEYYS